MSSVATRLHNIEISSPVLTSSTSKRVSAQLGSSPSTTSSTEDMARRHGQLRADEHQASGGSPNLSQKDYSNGRHTAAPSNGQDMPDCKEPTQVPVSIVERVPGFVVPIVEGITDDDIHKVEMFYRSQQTQVHVCRSLTNMYLSAPKQSQVSVDVKLKPGQGPNQNDMQTPPQPSDIAKDDWDFSQTGIPVLVQDTGEHRRDKRLRLVLAEKGTGFTLWQDELSHTTRYRTPHSNFHTVTISTDISRLVGFSFDEAEAATQFAEAFRGFTQTLEEDMINAGKKKSKKKKEKKPKFKPPKKIDISQPCCFVHVTKLERPDLIGGMFPPPPNGADLSKFGIPRATSESSGISECSTNPSDY
ncbi:misexpression suppressor of ras [Plakobranchus ocellatus]|uniref:Misexpression suppressor of ras n=1 Tax=Plakobranchus ocellatus TaxID=259542 RepID=A0AAV3XYG5_9GAST|nr:misexpression suppressor of ras [Plakobranchus ocellatus]